MLEPLESLAVFGQIATTFNENPTAHISLGGLWGAGRSLFALTLAKHRKRPLLLITPSQASAEDTHDDLCTFSPDGHVLHFPPRQASPREDVAPSDEVEAERMEVLQELPSQNGQARTVVVASVRALLQPVVDPAFLKDRSISLKTGDQADMVRLQEQLFAVGYTRTLVVEARGEYAVRGGILDVFPISALGPVRLEFVGDTLESIRSFDPMSQISSQMIDSIKVLPRGELQLKESYLQSGGAWRSLLDYLPADTIVALDDPPAVRERIAALKEPYSAAEEFLTWDDLLRQMAPFSQLHLGKLKDGFAADHVQTHFQCDSFSMTSIEGNPAAFYDQLKEWLEEQYRVTVVCNNPGESRRLAEVLAEKGIKVSEKNERCWRFGDNLSIVFGRLKSGFSLPEVRFAILSDQEIFGRRYKRRTRRFKGGKPILSYSDLRPGDYVVHVDYGIGIYTGLVHLEKPTPGDYLSIQYAGTDKLFVPSSEIGQIQKYVGSESAPPKVFGLGSGDWEQVKERVKGSIKEFAVDLIELYATREAKEGFAFSADATWQSEFEDSFVYEETPDQEKAIEEVKRDMESARPMDRLICGDVGYGKTEVALRAAFKAVMDHKQVALLVPTTILAQQHFQTFCSRLADYPIRVEMLSRFRSPAEQKKAVEGLAAGTVDIVIGTHRLLSKDILFRDLGLVIIDEEQRFGVAHKERLKQYRKLVDVLTLTATPIPRTLHLSLMGIRDMSLINTPPEDRLPIYTEIIHFEEEAIRKALRREFDREGQAFFVHNRVESIYSVANWLQRLLPETRLGVAHGQMSDGALEEVMAKFLEREIDLLVATTIIQSGLDIPNVNTMVINRADKFGLSELYQLRGRVGRDWHRAYAYLVVPPQRSLTETAERRLKILEEFADLGSGFKLALHDLELRGAGNILGAEQHGQVNAVGFEMYCQMIREAVAELKGEKTDSIRELATVDLGLQAFLPDDYVPSPSQKLELYKKLATVSQAAQLTEAEKELRDRFGPPPAEAVNLLNTVRLRLEATDSGIESIVRDGGQIVFRFPSNHLFKPDLLARLSSKYGRAMELHTRPSFELRLRVRSQNGQSLFHAILNLLKDLG